MAVFPRILTLVGPLVTTIGSFVSAYEIWLAPSFLSARSILEVRKEMHERIFQLISGSYRVPPYTAEQRDEAVQKARSAMEANIADAESRHKAAKLADKARGLRALAWGLAAIGLGSVIQAVAVIIV